MRQEALTVAMVQGSCVAGGCGLATAHDFVIAADSARFLYSEVRIGFVAALVATFLPLRMRGTDIREMSVREGASCGSIACTKRLLLEVVGLPLDKALAAAVEANASARGTDDCRHGIATFLETKAPPRWR